MTSFLFFLVYFHRLLVTQGLQYTLENIQGRLVQYSSSVVASTQRSLSSLFADNNGFATQYDNSNGFQFNSPSQYPVVPPLVYSDTIHNQNTMFGTNINYFAQKYNEMIFVGSIYTQPTNWTLMPMVYNMPDNDVKQIIFIMNGTKVQVAEKMYVIYASMICGNINDIIFMHIFEDQSLIAFSQYSIVGNIESYTINLTNGTYLFLQLGYVTSPTCDHDEYIRHVADTFIFTALKDTLNTLEFVLSTFPSSIDYFINQYINNPYSYFGGVINAYLQTSDGNTWLDSQGNILNNAGNLNGFQYSNDKIINSTYLDMNGSTTWGRYFTHRTSQSCSFTSVLDIAPSPNNNYFSVSFSLEASAYIGCHVQNSTFVVNNITYAYLWQTIYSTCTDQTAPTINTLIIHPQNAIIGDSSNLFDQNYLKSCSLTNPFTQVQNYTYNKVLYPRQRIFYIMYMQQCQAGYNASNSTLSVLIAQSFIQQIDTGPTNFTVMNNKSTNGSSNTSTSGNLNTSTKGSLNTSTNGSSNISTISISSVSASTNSNLNTTTNSTSNQSISVSSSNSTICDYSCGSCGDTSKMCLSCNSIDNRKLSGPTPNTCSCIKGYFDNNSSSSCVQCDISCTTCMNSSTCSLQNLTIPQIKNNNLTCNYGFYDIQDGNCSQCHYSCRTCVDATSQCMSCDQNNNRSLSGFPPNYCQCNQAYYDNQTAQCVAVVYLNQCSTLNCQYCQESSRCVSCLQGFFLLQNQCVKCDERCQSCTGSQISQCVGCAYTSHDGTCKLCEEVYGLLTIGKSCQSLCGDGIIRFDRGEQCDDGNQFSNDGCSSKCVVEIDFICFPQSVKQYYQDHDPTYGRSVCHFIQGPTATLSYTKNSDNNILSLIFSQEIKQIDFCNQFQLTIQTLQQSQFQFQSQAQDQSSCLIYLISNVSFTANQIIQLDFNGTLTDIQDQSLITKNLIIKSKIYTYYSVQQQVEAQAIVKSQSNLNILILVLGLLVILLGGVEVYWTILDILTWVDNLYFMNVDYPLNIKLFFQYAKWTEIFHIPKIIILNQPTDDYYQSSPERFDEKQMSACFLASVMEDLYFCMVGLLVYLTSLLVCFLIEKQYTKEFEQKEQSTPTSQIDIENRLYSGQHLNNKTYVDKIQYEITIPKILKPVYQQFLSIKNNSVNIFVKLVLLVFLDFQTASILQIQAGEYTRHPFITFNVILSVLFQICGLYLPFYFYSVINQSHKLLENESYEKKYSAIYEDVSIKERSGKWYCIFSVLKKSIFVICLTCFYEKPILQSITCTLASCLNILVICYKSPFQDKISLIKSLIPELAISGALAVTIVLAINDQVLIHFNRQNQDFEVNSKFKLGWLILAFIFSSVLFQCIFLIQMIMFNTKQRCLILCNFLSRRK